MKIYRYEFVKNMLGIIRGLDLVYDPEDPVESKMGADVYRVFDDELPIPYIVDKMEDGTPICRYSFTSFFTEKGHEQFKYVIDIIMDDAKAKGVEIRCIELDTDLIKDQPVYKDDLQVCYREELF